MGWPFAQKLTPPFFVLVLTIGVFVGVDVFVVRGLYYV